VGLYREDPGPLPGGARHLLETLATLRHAPWRGRAVVLDVAGRVVGYRSNEFGGEVCSVDELYVTSDLRGRGHGSALFEAIERGEVWPTPLVASRWGSRQPTRARAGSTSDSASSPSASRWSGDASNSRQGESNRTG